VLKGGKPDTVIMSYAEYERLRAAPPQSLAKRRKLFNQTHKDWIADQNRFVEANGVFGEEFRPW
jgi:Post-segregation antitoxin CcdA